jgi:methanogenic corrinoid protein MtbC1
MSTVYEELKKAIIEYNIGNAKRLAEKVVSERLDPVEALHAMTQAIRLVGEGFQREELWLPDLVGAADAMLSAMPIIEQEIKRAGKIVQNLGIVVIGTVFGDIHSIGKTMVSTLLTAEGFKVHDVGINVKAERFVEAISEYKADILAMSALMTMTAPEQKKVVTLLENNGTRNKVKIMVGGSAITEEFADSIGADGYDPTAPGAVTVARNLIGR